MLRWIVGNVDANSALVLMVLLAATCVIATAFIVKRRSVLEINNELELAKYKEKSAFDLAIAQGARTEKIALAEITVKREIEMRRIDGNAIDHVVQQRQPESD